jgi:hypothetical protein
LKILTAIVLSLLLASVASAQSQSSQSSAASQPAPKQAAPQTAAAPPASTPAIDPAKEADIRRLLEVAGTANMMSEIMTNMEKNMKPMLTKSLPPGDYREKLIDLFIDKLDPRIKAMIPQLQDMAMVSYDKYLSDEDIRGLTLYYQTPLGKKTISVLPKIFSELQEQGQKLGEQVGRDTMLEVLSEHPELVKEMQEQRTSPGPATEPTK